MAATQFTQAERTLGGFLLTMLLIVIALVRTAGERT